MDPGDGLADGGGAQLVGEGGDGGDLRAAGAEQRDELVDAGLLPGAHAGEDLGDGAGDVWGGGDEGRRGDRRA